MTGSKTVKYSPLNLIVMTKVTSVAVFFFLSLFALYFSVLGKNCLTISKHPGHFIGGKKNIHEARTRIRIHSIFFYLY